MFFSFLISVAHAGVITDAPTVSTILGNVVTFLLSIVGVLAIIGIVISGILYLTAAGDMRRISLAKAGLVTSIIGTIIAFGAMILLSGINQFFS